MDRGPTFSNRLQCGHSSLDFCRKSLGFPGHSGDHRVRWCGSAPDPWPPSPIGGTGGPPSHGAVLGVRVRASCKNPATPHHPGWLAFGGSPGWTRPAGFYKSAPPGSPPRCRDCRRSLGLGGPSARVIRGRDIPQLKQPEQAALCQLPNRKV